MTSYNVERDPRGRFGRSAKVVETTALGPAYEAMDYKTNQLVCWYKFEIEQDLYTRLEKMLAPFLQVEHTSLLVVYAIWESHQPEQQHHHSTQFIDFVTQATSKITLREYLNAMTPLNMQDILLWSFQLASVLNCLHSREQPIVHGNIRPENIFFSIDIKRVLLGDLVTSWFLRQVNGAKPTSSLTEQRVVVPEQCWDEKDDIFAFGLCLFEMASCVEPKDVESSRDSSIETKKNVVSGRKEHGALKDDGDAANDSIMKQLKRLIKSCLGPKEMRPSATEILNDSLFYYQRRGVSGNDGSSQCGRKMTWERSVTDMSPMMMMTRSAIAACGRSSSGSKEEEDNNKNTSTSSYPSSSAISSFYRNNVVVQRNSPSGIPRHLVVQNQTKEPTRVVGDAQVEVLDSPESKNCVRLSIQIPIEGSFKRIEFNFDPLQDSPDSLAEEMVIELNLDALQFDLIKQDIERHLEKILGTFPTTNNSNPTVDNTSLHECTGQKQLGLHRSKSEMSCHVAEKEEEGSSMRKEEQEPKVVSRTVKDANICTNSTDLEHCVVSRQLFTEATPTTGSRWEGTFDMDEQLFWDSIYSGNKQQVGYYLQKNPALVCLKDEDQRTPLHIAAAEGYMELVQLFVSYGASLDVTDRWGLTPILEAVASNHQQIVEFLKSHQSSSRPNPTNQQKIPAFYILPSYYPIFDSHCSLTAQELVSIMYGQDAILDASDESSTLSSLHTTTCSTLPELQPPPSHCTSWNKEPSLNGSKEYSKEPTDLTFHSAEMQRIEEEYQRKKEQLQRQFTQAKSKVSSKVKQAPSLATNSSSLVSLYNSHVDSI
jgi:serine/threonine protein kinase